MLTFILLVVLGGGVGLLVVSLAESSKPTADGPPTPRAEPDPQPVPVPVPEPEPAPVAEPEPAWELVAVEAADEEPAPALPPRRRRTGEPVPRSQVAVEGRFADVARVPIWRRFAAVVGIVTISVLSGVLIAAILAAMIGAAAELVNTAIG